VRDRHAVRSEEALPDGVEGTGADIAVDDPDSREREPDETAPPAVRCVASVLDHYETAE
jgi:hypothetical protein